MFKKAKFEYTIGGGVAGAIAGLAMTKLLEDEDKKATASDYLIGSGLGLGLGALGGRVADEVSGSNLEKGVETEKLNEALNQINQNIKANEKNPDYYKKRFNGFLGIPHVSRWATLPPLLNMVFARGVVKPAMSKAYSKSHPFKSSWGKDYVGASYVLGIPAALAEANNLLGEYNAKSQADIDAASRQKTIDRLGGNK